MTENISPAPAAGPALRILEIERFAIHDGPGIRGAVFFKGCPLRCPWCANPESWGRGRRLMHQKTRCAACGACAAACPNKAVRVVPGQYPAFGSALCARGPRGEEAAEARGEGYAEALGKTCGKECGEECAAACPGGALRFAGEIRRPADILAEVLRDAPYYAASSGGLTLTGGEPFFQPRGLLALLRAAKGAGLHIVVETCGQAAPRDVREAEPYIDIFYFDYKHPNAGTLQKATGARPRQIEENLGFLARKAPQKLVVRTPVIPGFNDGADVVGRLCGRLLALGLREWRLLPCHNLGAGKYEQLGLGPPKFAKASLPPEALKPLLRLAAARGLNARIGE